MKRLLCGLLAGVLLLSACQTKQEGPKTVIRGGGTKPKTSTSSASKGAGQKSTELIEQFAQDLEDTNFDLTADTPETEGEIYQTIRTDEEFGKRVAKILTENQSHAVSASEGTGRKLTLQAENGDMSNYASFQKLEETDNQSGQMLASIEMGDGSSGTFLYDKTVFEQLDALYRERLEGIKTEFSGNIAILTSKFDLKRLRDETGYDTNEFLQFGTRVLWRFTPHTEGYVKPSTIELLDTVTGQSVYTSSISETVTRMEKFSGEEGFDYRLITPTGIFYRSSTDRTREKVWRLPGIVSLFSASEELSGTFDMQYGKLAYASGDGIYLSDADGGNAQPLLFHNALAEIMRSAAGAGYTYYFNDPHFLSGGKRLSVSIVSPQTGQRRLGFAVMDLDSRETSYFAGATAANGESIHYLGDKVVSAQDEGIITLMNAENGDRGALPLNGLEGSLFFTQDCKSFLVWEPKVTGNTAFSSSMYLCGNQNINDRSRKLLGSYGGEYQPVGITEEYVIGANEDSRGLLLTATRYQTLNKTASQASSSSSQAETSSSESSSSSKSENAEGELPPDITPDL